MTSELMINTDASYQQMEEKAYAYFATLSEQHREKTYITQLTKDIQLWKKNHIHPISSLFSNRKKEIHSKDYHLYIKYLHHTGKLENYLERSISYIYMRDLGKALDSSETQRRILKSVKQLKNYLVNSTKETRMDSYSLAGLFRWSQKEGVESSFIWLTDKLKTVRDHIPKGLNSDEAQRKLIKIIAGVVMHVLEEMDEQISPKDRAVRLDEAIRLGYSYGLTYPFIDDLLDSNILSPLEKERYTNLIRSTLTTGIVPELDGWNGKNKEFIQFVHAELRDAFKYIQSHQRLETTELFYKDSFVFFQSQEDDRNKSIENPNYTNEEIYIPVILKSAASRLIVRSIISAQGDEGFENRTFYYGVYNQLADDFADMFEDEKTGSVTPYTYYLKYYRTRKDLINPFELYWTVISFLIHEVYQSDYKTREVILNRAINGLKRFKKKWGAQKYEEIMGVLTSEIQPFNGLIQKMVKKADDVDFFDKLIRDHMIDHLRKERNEREEFIEMTRHIREKINSRLQLKSQTQVFLTNDYILDAVNYSLGDGGKRIRPIITWMMATNSYNMDETDIFPLLRSLEYLHTASLIFDDLPSQDNASLRRGKSTLHEVYNVATAELSGLYLTQKAVEEQTTLQRFNAEKVLELIHYSSSVVADMCRGQAMDLEAKNKQLTIEHLNKMCFYKTGIGFEASLMMPAILAGVNEEEKKALKKFAYHTGIAFQIKDDLLDHQGNTKSLGKPALLDLKNNKSTFVTVLGQGEAKRAMWEHYGLALDAFQEIPGNKGFLKHFLSYIVNRDH
ncbi:polyprenyl synthetase family protein [Oceanobacillus sp. Castelsardo]|uniref:polyprenyl synthetase family protein n=1 Tax=Oceanobacillus sp. Castelsardo TaxID=1851204 RepID=UPI000A71E29E|nr:polyprenyl synthetase family protein [Oceanobacillus sp. Castelsardo]